MNTTVSPETPLRGVIRHELQAIRGKWVWLVALGIALQSCSPRSQLNSVATRSRPLPSSALILVGGIAEAVGAFWCREWSGFFLAVLSGTLGVVIGLMLLANPIPGESHDLAGELPPCERHLPDSCGALAPLRGVGLAAPEWRGRHRGRRYDLATAPDVGADDHRPARRHQHPVPRDIVAHARVRTEENPQVGRINSH